MAMFGVISAALGAIGSFASGAISTVGSICSSIGGKILGGIGSFAESLIRNVDIMADRKPGIFDWIRQIISDVGIAGERPEEMGMKVEQSREKPEDFDSIQAYINHLHKDIQVDQERLKNLSEVEKIGYGALGCALYIKGLEEKSGMEITVDFLKEAEKIVNSGKMSNEGIKNTLDGMKERGINSTESFSNYMDGKATIEEQMAVYDSLKEALHKEFPDLSDADLNVKVTHINDFMQDKQ